MTTASPKDFHVSWEDMHRDTRALAWRLQDMGPWTGIVAVTRGGLVPACIIARELDVTLIENFCITTYEHTGKEQVDMKILKYPDAVQGDGAGWLIIDDLVDTGNTFKIARETLPKAHYACIYAKPKGEPFCDTFVTEVSQDTWIHFPWEV